MPVRGGSRGRKKPSLHDLSRRVPTQEEYTETMAQLAEMHPRAAALVLGSMLDSILENAISLNFVDLATKPYNDLFRSKAAPLQAFAAKIALGHALGIYSEEFRAQLDTFRQVRNVFAHSTVPLDFDEPTIAAECRQLELTKLTEDPSWRPWDEHDTPRLIYATFAKFAAAYLIDYVVFKTNCQEFGADVSPWPFRSKYALRLPPPDQNQD